MELIRIGDKLIDLQKVNQLINKIIDLRSKGSTQTDVAMQLGVERTFISHLETLGSVRRGKRVAIVGFPIKNIDEVQTLARQYGVDYTFLLSEKSRQDLASTGNSVTMFNNILEIIADLRDYDTVIFLGSDKRIELVNKILNREVLGISIGSSPITKDVTIDIKDLENLLSAISKARKGGRKYGTTRGSKRKPWLLKKRPQRRSGAARASLQD